MFRRDFALSLTYYLKFSFEKIALMPGEVFANLRNFAPVLFGSKQSAPVTSHTDHRTGLVTTLTSLSVATEMPLREYCLSHLLWLLVLNLVLNSS